MSQSIPYFKQTKMSVVVVLCHEVNALFDMSMKRGNMQLSMYTHKVINSLLFSLFLQTDVLPLWHVRSTMGNQHFNGIRYF